MKPILEQLAEQLRKSDKLNAEMVEKMDYIIEAYREKKRRIMKLRFATRRFLHAVEHSTKKQMKFRHREWEEARQHNELFKIK